MGVRIKLFKCPSCGTEIDEVTSMGKKDAVPTKGTFSACLNCAAILRFTSDTEQKIATQSDLDELKKESIVAYVELMMLVSMLQARARQN